MRNIIYYSIFLLMQLFLNNPLIAGEKVNQSVDLGGNRQATWYLPDAPPNGWILLQHGFQRNKSNLDDLATHLMDNGLMVLTINSSVSNGNPSLAKNVADALVDNPLTPPNGFLLPDNLVIAGHSAGALFVSHMGGRLVERGFAHLKGAILFDPVDANNGMLANLQSVLDNGSQVLSILANSSSCNSSNNALTPLRALNKPFVGIKLTKDSKHTDVEGSSTGGVITWLCGTPKASNIAYLQDFALHWFKDMLSGNVSADYYPGGNKIQQLLTTNNGVLIKAITQPLPPSANFSFTTSQLSVQFSNSSSDADGNIVAYQWQFGDGQTSVLENPSHNYNNPGTYTVSLTVTDNDNQTASINKSVTVIENSTTPPAANFSFTKNNLEVSFSDTSSDSDGTISGRLWIFGDGATSTQMNPVHTYAAAGSYQVTLEVTDNDGLTDNKTQSISVSDVNVCEECLVNGEPVTGLTATKDQAVYFKLALPAGARDLKIVMSGGTGDADIYVRYGAVPTTTQYDYRPYKNGNNETVEVASPQSGMWHLMVRAYSTFSGVTLKASYITPSQNQPPNAAFNTSANGLSVSFTDISTDVDGSVLSWLWSFGDGSESSLQNPTHEYANAGTYNVTLLIADDDDASDDESKSIVVSEVIDDTTEIFNGAVVSGLSASTGNELHFVLKNVPPETAQLKFLMEGGSGDADIYIRYGAKPTTTEYDYRPYRGGNYEVVDVTNAQAGNWYVMVRAYQTFSGVNLTATHTVN